MDLGSMLLSRCVACESSWMDTFNYEPHIRTHVDGCKFMAQDGIDRYKCNICKRIYKTLNGVSNHFRQLHTIRMSRNGLKEVDGNAKVTVSESGLENTLLGIRDEFGVGQIKFEKFPNESASIDQYSKSLQRYFCKFPKCEFSAGKSYELKNHVSTLHLPQKAIYNCPQCSYTAKHESSMNMHIGLAHRSEILVLDKKCSECTMSFATNYRLECHLRIAHNKSLKEYTCGQCPVLRGYPVLLAFDTKYDLESHVQFYHKNSNSIEASELSSPEGVTKAIESLMAGRSTNSMLPRLSLHQCKQCNAILCNDLDLEEHALEQHQIPNNIQNSCS